MTVGAIIGGSGYSELLSEGELTATDISTPFGEATVLVGSGRLEDLAFVSRHTSGRSADYSIPPHRVNYRANLMALHQLGVESIVAFSAVGGLVESVPPGTVVLVDQLIDFTHGRRATFYDGGEWGVAYTDVTEPYCSELRRNILELCESRNIAVQPEGTYVARSGPRSRPRRRSRVYALLGGTVVGMTSAPETTLARELGIHYALICMSTNYAAGLEGSTLEFHREHAVRARGRTDTAQSLAQLAIAALRLDATDSCTCRGATSIRHPPTAWQPPE